MSIIDQMESNVRYYSKSFPNEFCRAKDCYIFSKDEKKYLDFFAGAGALNYGHNNDIIKKCLIDYIENDGITHGLDFDTEAKRTFLRKFNDTILLPRKLEYKIMFCGPTGTNSVEAAIKLARKVTKRKNIISFTGAFHGVTLGSLALSGSKNRRLSCGVSLNDVTFMPYPFGFNLSFDTIEYLKNMIDDDHSGIDLPAAVIFETVQAEGGVIIPEIDWIKRLYELCHNYGILLICDDIQVGCGRTGTFFSFERAGIEPDLVTLSKSVSGYGLPMSLLLIKKEFDDWESGEHNGTFRGNQLAFVGATAALAFYDNNNLMDAVKNLSKLIDTYYNQYILPINSKIAHRGLGLIHAFDFYNINPLWASLVQRKCFQKGLIIETSGRKDSVLKIMPPLIISEKEMILGLSIIRDAIIEVETSEHKKQN